VPAIRTLTIQYLGELSSRVESIGLAHGLPFRLALIDRIVALLTRPKRHEVVRLVSHAVTTGQVVQVAADHCARVMGADLRNPRHTRHTLGEFGDGAHVCCISARRVLS